MVNKMAKITNDKKNSKELKDIRFRFPHPADYPVYQKFLALAIINGKTESALWSEMMRDYVAKNQALLNVGEFLTVRDLYERYTKDFGNETPYEAFRVLLVDWRAANMIEKDFHFYTNGKSYIYNYDAMKIFFQARKDAAAQGKNLTRKTREALKEAI